MTPALRARLAAVMDLIAHDRAQRHRFAPGVYDQPDDRASTDAQRRLLRWVEAETARRGAR